MGNWVRKQGRSALLILETEADEDTGVYEVYVAMSHDWGSEIMAETRAVRSGPLAYEHAFTADDLSAAGVHKITWRYTVSGTDYYKYDYIQVYDQYISKTAFFDLNPGLEAEYDDAFDTVSLNVRETINTHCGQDFYSYLDKAITFDGEGDQNIHLGTRLDSFTEVLIDSEDYTSIMETDPRSKYFLRFMRQTDNQDVMTRSSFPSNSIVSVTGNWGWGYVPTNITRAAALLISDHLTDDHNNFRYGVDQIWLDSQRFEFRDELFGTTGNLDADLLLMDYIYWVLDYVT